MSEGLPLERKDDPQSNVCSDGYRTAPFTVPDRNDEDNGKAEGDEIQGVRVARIPNKARSCHNDSDEHIGESEDTTSLLSSDRAMTRCPSCYSFWRSYRSSNPQSSITPVAIVILSVLFVIYVLNQADKLVLAVLIPAGLRCEAAASNACPNVTSNVTTNSSVAATWYYGSLYGGDGNDSIMTNDTSVLPADCIHFTDDEQGIMTGPAFTVMYVVAGLPMARLADTRSRSLIILAGLAFWSVVMILMGFVNTFWELLLLRVLLGVGEVSGRGQIGKWEGLLGPTPDRFVGGAIGVGEVSGRSWRGWWGGLLGVGDVGGRGYWGLERSVGGAIGSWRGQWEGLLGVGEVSGRGYWELERSVGEAIGGWRGQWEGLLGVGEVSGR